jgi:hypothetical protein
MLEYFRIFMGNSNRSESLTLLCPRTGTLRPVGLRPSSAAAMLASFRAEDFGNRRGITNGKFALTKIGLR